MRADFRADVDAMAALVNDNTALVVGSAPQYPQGVIDPIPELAALAARCRRVDARRRVHGRLRAAVHGAERRARRAVGLPGRTASPRSRPTCTSSATRRRARRCSCTARRSCAATRRSCSTTGSAGSTPRPGMQGTRPGLPMATAWAVMHRLGIEGYRRLTRTTIDATRRMIAGVRAIAGLARARRARRARLRDRRAPVARRVRRSATRSTRRGWLLDRQKPPDSLHATVSAGNAPVVDEFLRRPARGRRRDRHAHTDDRGTEYATLE